MPLVIDQLNLTLRVTGPRQATALQQRKDQPGKRAGQHVLLKPVPRSAASSQAALPPRQEQEAEVVADLLEALDVHQLADRVYEHMRYDARVDRERRGQPL